MVSGIPFVFHRLSQAPVVTVGLKKMSNAVFPFMGR